MEDWGLHQRCLWTQPATLCPPAGTLAQAGPEPSAPSCPQPARAVQHVQGKMRWPPAPPRATPQATSPSGSVSASAVGAV